MSSLGCVILKRCSCRLLMERKLAFTIKKLSIFDTEMDLRHKPKYCNFLATLVALHQSEGRQKQTLEAAGGGDWYRFTIRRSRSQCFAAPSPSRQLPKLPKLTSLYPQIKVQIQIQIQIHSRCQCFAAPRH